jgi:3-phosphoshikimate 1-carboxyvinyltransferase
MNDSRHLSFNTKPSGSLRVPGDKSISHRLAMLLGLTTGSSVINGFLASEDCLNTLGAVQQLGASATREGTCVTITGAGGHYVAPAKALDLGNSGTGMRLIAGLLAAHPFESVLTGDASLQSRPMGRIRDPLIEMGARIALTGERGFAPMTIHGGALHAIDYVLPMASAQVKSCALLAGLLAEGVTRVVEPEETRDHTERLMNALSLPCVVDGLQVSITGSAGASLNVSHEGQWNVPGDFSSAAFWIAAAAITEGSEVVIEHVGLNPRRTAFLDVMRRMGARIDVEADATSDWEPVGRIIVRGGPLQGTTVAGAEIPNLIDELPLVAIVGAVASGTTRIADAHELRVKETDRIAAMIACLEQFGVTSTETEDGMVITGGQAIRGGGRVNSYGDHRIAMAGSILSLRADAPVDIDGIGCIRTSYPEFWDHFEHLVGASI